jgi:hypothetical protein
VTPRNDWMLGYQAAMKSDRPADFDDWFRKSPAGTHFDQWIAGWHSVWKCERLDEALAPIAADARCAKDGAE